jgi:hypothetical protein
VHLPAVDLEKYSASLTAANQLYWLPTIIYGQGFGDSVASQHHLGNVILNVFFSFSLRGSFCLSKRLGIFLY